MRLHRLLVPLLGLAVFAGGCTSVPVEELGGPPSTSTTEAVDDAEGDDPPASTTTSSLPATRLPADIDLSGLGGELAISGPDGLEITKPDGTRVGLHSTGGQGAAQPTWSRDGEMAVATVLDGPSGGVVVVRDAETFEAIARRPYFFYSWNPTGEYIAALGPGAEGTTLDIVGPDGAPVADDSLSAGSFYLAWEPGGDDLVIHRDRMLELVRDPLDLNRIERLGEPGQSFLAPAWIPGTREVLIVEERADGNRLVRLDVDTLARDDLGPVDGSIGIVVAPDGGHALLAHGFAGEGGDIAVAYRPVADVTASTEVIDLASGARQPVTVEQTLWAEWSPDGSKVALLQPDAVEGVEWVIWNGAEARRLGPFLPTFTFFRNYVFFAWQFTESPRVWSPRSDAIVYAATTAGTDAVWVHALVADEAVRVASGSVAFWSPR